MTQERKQQGVGPLAALRQFARPRRVIEACELCALPLGPVHDHLIEPATRRLLCSCPTCAALFAGAQNARFRRVPRRIESLADFRLSDGQWEELQLPINLAFFYHSSVTGRVTAVYPSPAGATESLLSLEAWHQLESENPVLRELEADVEALLVHRVGQARDHFRVPIDRCYELVGIIRTNWRGLSGGADVWAEINKFFARLREQAGAEPGGGHA